jgi:hypothetical protein
MRKNTRFRPAAFLLIALLMAGLVAPVTEAAQSGPTEQETPRPIVQKQGWFAYFLSLFFPLDRLDGADLLQKRKNSSSDLTGTEPTPTPDPEPQTTEGGGEDDGEGRGTIDPNG